MATRRLAGGRESVMSSTILYFVPETGPVEEHCELSNSWLWCASVWTRCCEKLLGIVPLRELVLREPTTKLSDIMREPVVTVHPTMDQEEVAKQMAKYDLNVVPVVDDKHVLLGVITIDDIVDVLTQEQTEDVQKLGGVQPLEEGYFQTSFWAFIRKRGVVLVILFIEEFFTQTAMRHYDWVLDAIKGAAYYVPLLISTGGNSGGQSSTLIIRGLATGEIRPRDWWRILFRELGMGLALGSGLGFIGMLRVKMYPDQSWTFAFTVAAIDSAHP